MHTNAAVEAMKKQLVFERLMSICNIYTQGSVMAAIGERRDRLLETHIHFAQSYHPFLALMSLLITEVT